MKLDFRFDKALCLREMCTGFSLNLTKNRIRKIASGRIHRINFVVFIPILESASV